VAFDEKLADRIRDELSIHEDLTERKMFGGLAFLLSGHMAIAASGQGGALVRVDPTTVDRLTADPRVHPAVMGGRTMGGWVRVDESALRTARQLDRWIGLATDHVRSLPPKAR
jgi:TfoX/Sxy family transcriptional regulator of competence genes